MELLTVVEAASLSGLPPEVIRSLIRQQRLPARTIALPSGPAYLIEAAALEPFTGGGRPGPDLAPEVQATSRRARLEAALAGLQAALASRGSAAEGTPPNPEHDDPLPPASGLPPSRTALGLRQDEVSALVARIDGLLTAGDERKPEIDALSS